jgi:hypothetical protein
MADDIASGAVSLGGFSAGGTAKQEIITTAGFKRPTAATYFDATGILQSAAANVLRFDYGPSPGGVTNWVSNSNMVGAVIGTPGTFPTTWGPGNQNGIANNLIATGTISGMPYVDVQFVGTSTGVFCTLGFQNANVVAATVGQTWVESVYVALVGGSLTNITTNNVDLRFNNGGGTIDTAFTPTATLTRFASTATVPVGSTLGNASFVMFFASGVAINVTLRFAGPQLERGSTPSTFVPTSTVAVNTGANPAVPLLETARTNSLLFSQDFSNAAWAKNAATTVTPAFATGLDGTATAARLQLVSSGNQAVTFVHQQVSGTGLGASQTHIVSGWVKSNTAANQTFALKCTQAGVLDHFSSDLTATTTWQRFNFSVAFASGGTGFFCGISTGAAAASADVVVWGFQLEQNAASPTSYIPTAGAAATRAADAGPLIGYPVATVSAGQYDIASGTGLLGAAVTHGVAAQFDIASGVGSLGPVSISATVGQYDSASGSPTLGAFVTLGSAAQFATASGAGSLGPVTAHGVAAQYDVATGAPTLGGFVTIGLAAQFTTASGAPTLGAFAALGSAGQFASASGAGSLGPFTALISAAQYDIASGTLALGPFTLAGAGAQFYSAAGTISLGTFQATGSIHLIATTGVDDTIVRRYADAMERKGFRIVLRRISYVGGALPNPPILTAPVLDGTALAGATSIAIRASQAEGRIVQGDRLRFGTNLIAIKVAADATARGPETDPAHPATPGFATILLATPLLADVPDGTPIVASWSADQRVWATEQAYALSQRSDQILTGDLNVAIAAFNVVQPNAIDQLIFGGVIRSIVSIERSTVRGQTVAWKLQAR